MPGRSAALPKPVTPAAPAILRLAASAARSSSASDRHRWPGCLPVRSAWNASRERAYIPRETRDSRRQRLSGQRCNSAESSCHGCSEGLSRNGSRSEEHTSELQSRPHLVCRLLLEKKKKKKKGGHFEKRKKKTAFTKNAITSV